MRNLLSLQLSWVIRNSDLFFRKLGAAAPVLVALTALSGLLLMKGDGPEYLPNTWVDALGSTTAVRSGGCAVLLRDGRVLLAGGENAGTALASAELMDASGRFRPAANMSSPHSSPACAMLPDGAVMVAGGRVAGGFSNATEIYDPTTGEWNAGPPLVQGRAGAAVALLTDGRVLLSGGETAAGPSDLLEIYDPRTRTFEVPAARLSSPRTRHAAANLPDGRVLIAGGWDGAHALDTAEIFDPAGARIENAGRLSTPRAGLSATTLLDGRVLVAGGSNGQGEIGTAEIFDPQTARWAADTAVMLVPRQGHTALLVPYNNTVLFVGGTATGQDGPAAVAQTEVYIPWRHEFRAAGNLPHPAAGVMAVALAQPARIAAAGGRGTAVSRAGAEILSLPAIQTDQPNYRPGDTVRLRGSGWVPAQPVGVSVPEDASADSPAALTAIPDEFGNWTSVWTTPDSGARGITVYPTATQQRMDANGRATVLTARTAVTNAAGAMKISANCKGNGGLFYAFGTALCASISNLSAQISSEQFAWVAPGGTIYALSATASGGQASDTEILNGNGTWTVKAYPAGSCAASSGQMVCTGTPDGQIQFSVSGGKLVFTTPAVTFPAGGCSPAITVELRDNAGAAVAPTFPTPITLSSSSSLATFSATPACGASVTAASISAGAASTTFYYSDKAASATVVAGASNLPAATQTEKTTVNPPTLSMVFASPTVALSGTTTLTFTLTNPAANSATLTGIAFNDYLPVQLAVATPNGVAGTCGGGSVTAAAGSSTVSLSGASLAPNTSCTFSVDILGRNVGPAYNSAIPSSSNGGSGTTAVANTTVAVPPSISQAFGAQTIPLNGSTPLSFIITNPVANVVPLSGVSFTDSLPAGLAVASPGGSTGNCGGTVAAAAGSGSITLSGGSLGVNASCSVVVNVTATSGGSKTNTVSVASVTGGAGNTASGNIAVATPPTVTAAFGAASVPLNGVISLSFTIANPSATTALSGVGITDALPPRLAVATPNGLTGSCGAGTISAAAGGSSIALAGGTLAAGASCTFAVNVTGTAAGQAVNATGAVTSVEGGAGTPASATLLVMAPPALSLAFGSPSAAFNGTASLTFMLANPAANPAPLTGVGFTDSLPAGLTVEAAPSMTNSCGGAVTAAAGSTSIQLTNGSLAVNGSCSVVVSVSGTAAGTLAASAQAISTNGGSGTPASASLLVVAPPSIALSFGTGTIGTGASTTITFAITNPALNSVALTGIAFSNSLPVGLAVAANPGITALCGGSVSAAPGSTAIALSGGTLPPNGSCAIAVNVTASAAGTLTDTVQVSSTNGGAGNTASAALQVQATATHLAFAAPVAATAGTAFTFTVTALDASNHVVTSYAGTVQFATTDVQAVLPAPSTLTGGAGSFSATLKTAGSITITAADAAARSVSGAAGIAVSAGAPSSILATAGTPQSATINAAFGAPLQATVKDAFGNTVSGAVVSFSTPAAGASAILTNSTASTNSSGIASVTAAANSVSGSYTVQVNIASAAAAFVLTNLAAVTATSPPAQSLQLTGAVAGTYSVPNAAPYNALGSFYIDLRVSNWSRLAGACASLAQFVTSPQYGPSRIQLCDPSYGWGAINVGEYLDATSGGTPLWMQAPNIAISSATATNPMKITLASAPFPAAMSVGRTITIANAAGAGCSGMNANQTITAVSGNTLTLKYDGTGCAYTANSGIALSQDFVFRYHRDLAAKQLIGEVWNVDGTGHASKALAILGSASIALPASMQIGAQGVTANLGYLRWYSGTIPVGAPAPSGTKGGDLGDWEFDGNGNDQSGHNLNLSFAGAAAYVSSPSYPPACSAGASQSFRVGQPATLDGTGSYPLDGGSTLTYSWSPLASLLGGVVPQTLQWSSTTAAQPTVTGFGFGPLNFQLTVTQGDGQSSTCTVHDGAVQTNSSGVVINFTGSSALDNAIALLIGGQMQLGANPWPFYDQVATADAAVQIADMDVHYQDYWNNPDIGTVSVTTGSHIVNGSGTAFTTTFCQGPGNPSTPKGGASIIVWYLTGRTVNGAPETGRRRMMVNSCASDTQLYATLPSNGTGWASDAAAGSGLNYTADFYQHLWEFSGAPANYYDNVHAYYVLYYRSGIDTYLDAARKLADRFWTSPEIDRGMAFNVGDWFGAQSGRANSISGLVLRALDTFDGHPDMWSGLHNVWSYTDWLLSTAYPNWSSNGGIDGREYGYTLAQAAYGALWDPDPTWQAYCRSMIASTFQTGDAGIWPKNLDSVQQAWLQWFQMKSTFDANQPWSGSTVTLNNGSNVATCTSGSCGWQASDFVAYDAGSGAQCANGTTCATVPVLFTDSALFPADSSHTDGASYCYPNACTFIDSNHFQLDRPYSGTSGTHGWVFGVSNGSVGATAAGVVGYGGLPYMEGILGWAFDLAGTAMACDPAGAASNCDNNISSTAYSYSANAANWITGYGQVPQYYGAAYFGGFPVCGASPSPANVWCNKGDTVLQSRELMGDAYRGLAAAYRRAPSPALKTTIDNWFSGMWAKPGTNPMVASPDGQYDMTFDPTGCAGCGFFITDGAPYSQKFFGQHFGISNEGGWAAVRLGY